jgi:hypothetical protein
MFRAPVRTIVWVVSQYCVRGGSPTQELVGLGVANVAGAMFNCYTTTGSFSRSAVNNLSGAKSQLAGTVTGLFIMLVLLLLTPVFTNLPQSVQVIHSINWLCRNATSLVISPYLTSACNLPPLL